MTMYVSDSFWMYFPGENIQISACTVQTRNPVYKHSEQVPCSAIDVTAVIQINVKLAMLIMGQKT